MTVGHVPRSVVPDAYRHPKGCRVDVARTNTTGEPLGGGLPGSTCGVFVRAAEAKPNGWLGVMRAVHPALTVAGSLRVIWETPARAVWMHECFRSSMAHVRIRSVGRWYRDSEPHHNT